MPQRLLSKNWRSLVNLVLDSSRQILQDLRVVDIVRVFPESFCDPPLEILFAVRYTALR